MNKAKKQSHKQGMAKRLVRGSFVLSKTRALSAKLLRFFESGAASPLFSTLKPTDHFARNVVSLPLTKKLGLRKNFSVPVRNSVASFLSRNPLMKRIADFRSALLNSSLRSVGVFLLTFSIYGLASFLLKRFVVSPLGVANPDDLSASAIVFLAGLLFTIFGDKTIINSLGTSRITGNLLHSCLGVNQSSFDRYKSATPKNSAVAGFIFGSLLGIFTIFFSPVSILSAFVAVLIGIAIMHIPEFGLLFAVAIFSFAPIGSIVWIVSITFASFLVKYVRLKRNFRFGTADVIALFMFLATLVTLSLSGGDISRSEAYFLAFISIYFLAKNLLCSETLVAQTFNALCTGLSVGMALYILGEYAIYIPHQYIKTVSLELTKNVFDAEMLFMMIALTLPFALFSFSAASKKRPNTWFVLMTIACAVVTDSLVGYVLILVSIFVFVACATKSPVGSLLASIITLPPVFVLLKDIANSSAVSLLRAKTPDAIFESEFRYVNYWTASVDLCGLLSTVLFVVTLVFVFQRIYGSTINNYSGRYVVMSGTLAASATLALACTFVFNPFSDIRVIGMMYFIFGFCGSVYKVCFSSQPETSYKMR